MSVLLTAWRFPICVSGVGDSARHDSELTKGAGLEVYKPLRVDF